MPKKAKELYPYQIKKLVKKPGLHSVGGVAGLHLKVKDTLAASWILRVMVGERRRDIGLGGYPDVSLQQARNEARQNRELIRQGIDPVAAKEAARSELVAAEGRRLTFKQAAVQYHRGKSTELRSVKHQRDWLSSLERYAFPSIGNLPVSDVEIPHVMNVLEPIWYEKTETATRVRQRMEKVLGWATALNYRQGDNPAAWKGNLEHTLPQPSKLKKVRHHRSLPWSEIGPFMADLRKREGMGARALEFGILTAMRSKEFREATWDEIDFASKVWTIPAERMKARKEHKVPLSAYAIKVLKSLPESVESPYVFVARRPIVGYDNFGRLQAHGNRCDTTRVSLIVQRLVPKLH